MKSCLSDVTKPAKANLDIPKAVALVVNRQAEGAINSANPAGGTVPIAYRPAGPGERGSV